MAPSPGYPTDRTLVLVGGTTRTAEIEGISAAGTDPATMVHTPSADLEIVAYGRPVGAPVVPVSPTGCPTPAVVTRAVRELLGFETVAVDAGLARGTAAPTVQFGDAPGDDIRAADPVPNAADLVEAARSFARSHPADELVIGETIPGGTTTALGVLTALGEEPTVSSSLPENPLARKREVVDEGLAASGLDPGERAGDPVAAVRRMGDPVLAVVSGLVRGAAAAGTAVTLAGGTQVAAAGALARHAGVEAPLELATTSFIANDATADIASLTRALDVELTVTDPGFEERDHLATNAYVRGEAKEGVGMGGALGLAAATGIDQETVRKRIVTVSDRLLETPTTR